MKSKLYVLWYYYHRATNYSIVYSVIEWCEFTDFHLVSEWVIIFERMSKRVIWVQSEWVISVNEWKGVTNRGWCLKFFTLYNVKLQFINHEWNRYSAKVLVIVQVLINNNSIFTWVNDTQSSAIYTRNTYSRDWDELSHSKTVSKIQVWMFSYQQNLDGNGYTYPGEKANLYQQQQDWRPMQYSG